MSITISGLGGGLEKTGEGDTIGEYGIASKVNANVIVVKTVQDY